MLFFNDINREKLCFTEFSTRMAAWLLLTFSIRLQNQLSSLHSIITFHEHILRVRLFELIHQIDSKNEWLLLSAGFTAKFGLVLVLALEKTLFLRRFILKPTEKA